jgi:hypothetical protein
VWYTNQLPQPQNNLCFLDPCSNLQLASKGPSTNAFTVLYEDLKPIIRNFGKNHIQFTNSDLANLAGEILSAFQHHLTASFQNQAPKLVDWWQIRVNSAETGLVQIGSQTFVGRKEFGLLACGS